MSERINARLSQPLAEFVDRMVGEAGLYETPSEYVRDLIRRDKTRLEQAMEERLRIELAHAFAAPESAYTRLTAGDVIARNKA